MPDPVSWKVVEPGWTVRDAAGNAVGQVVQVTGDPEADIFDGLTIDKVAGVLARPRYVPSEHVQEIREGEVLLDLDAEAVQSLQRYEPPPAQVDLAREAGPPPDRGEGPPGTFSQRLARFLLGRRP